jgi:hypothetical protein
MTIKTGILWIKNPPVFSRTVPSILKISREKESMKSINRMTITLGDQ